MLLVGSLEEIINTRIILKEVFLMKGIGATDIGKVRLINQDCIFISNEKIGMLDNLYIVADGIGGNNAGDVASQKSIEFFVDFIKNKKKEQEIFELMLKALSYANKKVYELSKTKKIYENMGTTFLALTIKNKQIFVIHIGDSRLYSVRDSKIKRLTIDHTYAMDLLKAGLVSIEQVDHIKEASVLTKFLGTDTDIKADTLFYDIFKDDLFIMCSDGLSGMLLDEEIKQIALNKSLTSKQIVQNLINTANEKGGKDNIAVIILK